MKRIIMVLLLLFTVTGCTVVRIDTASIDNTINVVLSKNNNLYNRVGKGYKYYVPKGVSYIDTTDLNDKLYSNGNYYYLYIDVISYFYQKEVQYTKDEEAYFSKVIDVDGKKGYVEINKQEDKYLIEFIYNYAKIEAIVEEKDINEVILNSSYILSTIKFNNNVIRLMLDDDFLINKEEKYEEFTSKEETDNKLGVGTSEE